MATDSTQKAYKILGLSFGATKGEIKKAYHYLAKKHHPDHGGTKETFQVLQQAYEYLMQLPDSHFYKNPDDSTQKTTTTDSKHQHPSNSYNHPDHRSQETKTTDWKHTHSCKTMGEFFEFNLQKFDGEPNLYGDIWQKIMTLFSEMNIRPETHAYQLIYINGKQWRIIFKRQTSR